MMMLYKYQEKLYLLCKKTIKFAYFMLTFIFIFFILSVLIIKYSPKEEVNIYGILIAIIIYIFTIVIWWKIFKYYAYDVILSLEIKDNTYYLRSYYKLYCITKKDVDSIKESFFGENIIIIFNSSASKKSKKVFKKYINEGLKKIENLNMDHIKKLSL